MLSIIDLINDLYNPILSFLPRALLVAAVSAVVCAIVGTHVVLRGAAFIGDAGSLQDFLFGSLTGVSVDDIPLILMGSFVVISILAFFDKELVAVSIDRETARALGIPVLFMDIVLYVSVALAVVISVQTIGNVLVLALLVAPAATARLVTNRMASMMTVASIISLISSFVGIYLSWALDLPAGATIVCVLTVVFASVWLCAPHHGILGKCFTTWKMRKNLFR